MFSRQVIHLYRGIRASIYITSFKYGLIFRLGAKTSSEANDKKTRDKMFKYQEQTRRGKGCMQRGMTKSSKGWERGIREQRGGR